MYIFEYASEPKRIVCHSNFILEGGRKKVVPTRRLLYKFSQSVLVILKQYFVIINNTF